MTARRFEVRHRTDYQYEAEVAVSYGSACLTPRDTAHQTCRSTRLDVAPEPVLVRGHVDYFGNTATYFEVHQAHTALAVTATSVVEVDRPVPDLAGLDGWTWSAAAAEIRSRVAGGSSVTDAEVTDFVLASPRVPAGGPAAELAAAVFRPDRPLGEALVDLQRTIHDEWTYDSAATTVSSTLAEVVRARRGVCQDFAHLAVACLRWAGLPARYVSGYLETRPPPGRPRLQGADASHAWVSTLVPDLGWIDLDPTNDQLADSRYVVTAWGRDYTDVPPLKGVIFAEKGRSTLAVAVDVLPLDEPVLNPRPAGPSD